MAKTQIKSLSMEQLLSHLEAVDMVCDFYDNEMKANTGQYDGEEVSAYNAANDRLLRYMKIREKIFNEIETRVDELC